MPDYDYTHIDIPIPRGHFVQSVEQRGDVIRVNYKRGKEWTVKKIDVKFSTEVAPTTDL